MSERTAERREERSHGRGVTAAGRERSAGDQKWAYLRTVYPLNPGIPHYLDFPGERE